MSNEGKMDFSGSEWYALWMKQSQGFFQSAEKNLHDIFNKHDVNDIDMQRKQMEAWLEVLKKQWQMATPAQEIPNMNYWQAMAKMCSEASDLLMQEWMQRALNKKPVQNVRELYELWLNCCSEVYKKSLQSSDYQTASSEFMQAMMDFWKNPLSR